VRSEVHTVAVSVAGVEVDDDVDAAFEGHAFRVLIGS
jgi:hypothetical protein